MIVAHAPQTSTTFPTLAEELRARAAQHDRGDDADRLSRAIIGELAWLADRHHLPTARDVAGYFAVATDGWLAELVVELERERAK